MTGDIFLVLQFSDLNKAFSKLVFILHCISNSVFFPAIDRIAAEKVTFGGKDSMETFGMSRNANDLAANPMVPKSCGRKESYPAQMP